MPDNKIIIPQAYEAEKSLLGALLIDPKGMKRISHIVTYDDFYENAHRLIFRAMEVLHRNQADIDVITIHDKLKERGYGDEDYGGPMYLSQLTNDVPTAAHLITYARTVADRAVLRRMIYASQDIIRMTQKNEDLDAVLKKAEERLKSVSKTSARTENRLQTVDIETWRKIAREQEADAGYVRGLSTGYKQIDEMVEGFEPGEMIILTGHTKHGKSRLATNIAVNVAQSEKIVLFINTEMTKMQTARRINNILGDEVIRGKIIVNDSAGLEHRDVIAIMEKAKEAGCDLVIVDHLHFFNRSVDNATNEISKITKEFKDAAVEFDLPLLMLCHVQQGDTKKAPTLQMLKNSSSIAQDADVVLTVWMDDRPGGDNSYTDVIRLAHRSASSSKRKAKLYNNGMKLAETDTRSEEEVQRQRDQSSYDARILGEKDDDLDDILEDFNFGDKQAETLHKASE